jgi:hypothetical protein
MLTASQSAALAILIISQISKTPSSAEPNFTLEAFGYRTSQPHEDWIPSLEGRFLKTHVHQAKRRFEIARLLQIELASARET